jgi:putative transport protein
VSLHRVEKNPEAITTTPRYAAKLSARSLPKHKSYLVGLYVLRMDPIVLAGAVAGARNSTTAMRAISDKAKSSIPSFGYPVPYALSTVVFLIYGHLAMLLS